MKKILPLLLFLISTCFFKNIYADKIAIIGGGASGLVTAWLLEQNHKVTLYEAQNRLGGHANSIDVTVDGTPVSVEAGAEFFNETHYPHFLKLLRYFHIPVNSFTTTSTVYTTDGRDEIIFPPYHDHTVEWKSLTPTNISRSLQLKMVIDSGRQLLDTHNTAITLKEFVDTLYISEDFKKNFFYPFMASQWGVRPTEIQNFSAFGVIKYIIEGNDAKDYQSYEVTGGLKQYIEAVRNDLTTTAVKLNTHISKIAKDQERYIIIAEDGSSQEFDHIVFATDAHVASNLLRTAPETAALAALLGKIKYYETRIAIHGDLRFMPEDKADWRVVNIRHDDNNAATTVYKEWKSNTKPIFKTWLTYDVRSPNDPGSPIPTPLYALIAYQHPIVDHYFFDVQKAIEPLQGNQHIWFAGMWTCDTGSHENAITSAINIAQRLAPNAERLKLLKN